jgi:hypothetical protein
MRWGFAVMTESKARGKDAVFVWKLVKVMPGTSFSHAPFSEALIRIFPRQRSIFRPPCSTCGTLSQYLLSVVLPPANSISGGFFNGKLKKS